MSSGPNATTQACRSPRGIGSSGFGVALIGLLLAGCGDLDSPTPLELDTAESVPSLRIGSALPSLPTLARDWGGEIALQGVLERWEESWTTDRDAGEAARDELYRAVLPILADEIPAREIGELARRLEFALAGVGNEASELPPGPLFAALDEAASGPALARAALERGAEAEALLHLVRAVDALHRATAEVMARVLIDDTRDLMRRISGGGSYSEERWARCERLLLGAEFALEEGNDQLALRRAFYAHRLLTDDEPW